MSRTSVTIDSSAIDRTLRALDSEETKRMTFNALRAGAKVLQSNTRQIMLTKGWNFNQKQREVGVGLKADPAYCEVRVYVSTHLGLHWLEKGTTPNRQLKKDHPRDEKHRKTLRKGENRGGITGTHFFRQARQNDAPVTKAIEDKFDAEFQKKIKQYNK